MEQAFQLSFQNGQNYGDNHFNKPTIKGSIREQNQAVGLLNIGNTCYFNSLLQIYYSLPSFVEKIL